VIPFQGKQFCQHCEDEIKVSGIVMLPGKEPVHLCFECALKEAVQYNADSGTGETTEILIVRPKDQEDEREN
jgi:hypothetical protein